MASNRIISFQLMDKTGKNIMLAGGMAQICAVNTPNKVSLFDNQQVAAANPIALNRGYLYAQVAKSNTAVDIYLASPTGHFVVLKGVVPGDRSAVTIDTDQLDSLWVIPFSISDSVANTEKDTGFDLPTGALVNAAGMSIEVVTNEGSRTLGVGTLSTESGGSATAFLAAISLATAGVIKASVAATMTFGAGVTQNFGTTPAVNVPESKVITSTNPSISYTLSASTVSANGFINLPVQLSKISALV